MMKTFRCMVCGYIYVGEEPPETCPICDAPSSQFEEVEGSVPENMVTGTENSQEPDRSFDKVVILGGGIAALSAAETLRQQRADLEITLITNELALPYYRLNLTKYLAGEISEGSLSIHQQYWYDDQRIKVFKNRIITEIDREAAVVRTADGLEITYDRLLIALGAHAFIPPIKGIHQPGITTLRLLEEAKELLGSVNDDMDVLVMGGGVLGLETAGALAAQGAKVTVVEGAPWLMPRQLNRKAATYLEKALSSSGIDVCYDFMSKEIRKTDNRFTVEAEDGRIIEADRIIVATGVRPNTYLTRMAGLEVDRGLVVDDCMRTSDQRIFAAGDITEHYGIAYGLWTVAQFQGSIAAMNLLGIRTPFGGVPRSNGLKVLDIDLFSVGEINALDASYSMRSKVEENRYICFVLRDQMPVGGIAIGYGDKAYRLQALVEAKTYLTPDEASDVEKLIERLT